MKTGRRKKGRQFVSRGCWVDETTPSVCFISAKCARYVQHNIPSLPSTDACASSRDRRVAMISLAMTTLWSSDEMACCRWLSQSTSGRRCHPALCRSYLFTPGEQPSVYISTVLQHLAAGISRCIHPMSSLDSIRHSPQHTLSGARNSRTQLCQGAPL